MTLDLALATYQPEGILRVARQNLPRVDGVRYIVSWQCHGGREIPRELSGRDDVEIHRFDRVGQSLNRNNAIGHCRADIILHADDDVTYTPEGLREVIRAFSDNPDVDVATFRYNSPAQKPYPTESVPLHRKLPKGYYAGGIEIAFRRSTAGMLRCHPELGLGSPELHGGEDEMFLMSAIRRGLNCRFFPVTICRHEGESTGTKSRLTPANLRANGCVIALNTPLTAPLRLPLKAWRVARKGQAGFFAALLHLTAGALAAPGVYIRGRKYLW